VCYIHAGASWNRHAFEEILGNGILDDHSLLRPSLKFFLFSQSGNNEEERLRDLVLDLLTTPTSGSICSTFGDVARVESYLWTLLSSSQYPSDILLPFKKEEIVECLKNFRSILTATGWKASAVNQHRTETSLSNPNHRTAKTPMDLSIHSHGPGSVDGNGSKIKESEEFLHVLHLLSILSRSLVLAWNSYEKVQIQTHAVSPLATMGPLTAVPSEVSLEALLNCLTPGSASDLANLILEGVTLCNQQVWFKKYESFQIRHSYHSIFPDHTASATSALHTRSSFDEETSSTQLNSPSSHSQALIKKRYAKAGRYLRTIDRKRYLGVHDIELPARSIFQLICKHIPNYSVDALHKIFEASSAQTTANGRVPSQETAPPNSSSSAWSLWRR
jgi:hypothetical protein